MRLDTEIRGYPLASQNIVTPCAIVSGPLTQLDQHGAIVASVHGYLHSLSFQSIGADGLTIHTGDANGNVAPARVVGVDQDHVALAVDSQINDFVVASQGYTSQSCWYVIPDHATNSSLSNCDPNVAAIHALATNKDDELLVAGTDVTTGAGRIDVYDAPASAAPQLVRSITGPATGLFALSTVNGYFSVSYSLTTDPTSGDIYVFDSQSTAAFGTTNPADPPPKISQFAPHANGNVDPLRVLSGPNVNLVAQAFSVNVLGVDDAGWLYAVAPGNTVSVNVFSSGQHGNASPRRVFSDPTAIVGVSGDAIAVRSKILGP